MAAVSRRLAVVALLSGAAAEMVNALRQRYDPRSAAVIGAHVTLAGPVETEVPCEEMARTLAKVATQTEALEVTVGGVRTFLPISAACYLDIEPEAGLRAVHDLLVARLGWREPFPYVPHVTITEYLTVEETERGARELEAAALHAQDCLCAFTLLEKVPSGAWVSRGEYPLRARC